MLAFTIELRVVIEHQCTQQLKMELYHVACQADRGIVLKIVQTEVARSRVPMKISPL